MHPDDIQARKRRAGAIAFGESEVAPVVGAADAQPFTPFTPAAVVFDKQVAQPSPIPPDVLARVVAAKVSPRRRRHEFLSFSPPSIGDEEVAEVVDTLRSEWISTGPKTARFEEEFAAYLNAPAALAVSSCTAALHVALSALEIGPGDEVITTTMTFAASVNVIEHVGARPVLVDVEPDTLNISLAAVAAAITPRTRAILPVHFAGHPADLEAIYALAEQHGLHVLEDAAHAVGARYRGRAVGSGPHPTAFSFYATKNLTTAEGGMLTGEADFIAKAKIRSLHGMSRDAWKRYHEGGSWFYEIVMPGYKYNMTDLHASLGLCQLRKMQSFQERRRQVAAQYSAAFSACGAFELPVERNDVDHAWHLYVLRLRDDALGIGRDRFIVELTERRIGTSVHFIPVHLHPFYRDRYGYRPESIPVAYDAYRRMLSLPLNPRLSDSDVHDVIDAVLDIATVYAT